SARRLDDMEADFRGVLGAHIFSREGEELAASVGRLLKERGKTLAVAESCTGGLVSQLVSDNPGSSAYFLGGVGSDADSAKTSFLSVSEETISSRGAVSGETALEMAQGAMDRFGADLALGVTGIAGPDGGTPEKPVGTVYFALARRGGLQIQKRRE